MRLFVAIALSDPVRSALDKFQTRMRGECDSVRWIPSHQLHLTVKFLGDVPDREVNGVSEALKRATASAAPFEMGVSGCGCFPERGPVRIVWAGTVEETGAMKNCARQVDTELERAGFPRERRPFSPHITMGRVRDDRSGGRLRSAIEGSSLEGGVDSIGSLTLMSSVLSPKGPTYTAVCKVNLGP